MEFRRYNKVNCSLFDLISGDLEPKQTMALGYLLAKSESALKVFLKLIGVSKPNYDKYVVDCEAQKKRLNSNSRIDILIRFYKNNHPLQAIIIEAKSVSAAVSSSAVVVQLLSYSSGFKQLNGFPQIDLVALTKVLLPLKSTVPLSPPIQSIQSITWTQLVSAFHDLTKKKEETLITEFINFITTIEGNMKYYEEEILAIPAGKTRKAVMASGIYECPATYRSRKQTLYISFKDKRGEMDMLYKLIDKYIMDINAPSAIQTIDNELPGFADRMSTYKQIASYKPGVKRIYVLDLDNPVKLPNIVRPAENNASPAYYSISEFVRDVNSNLGRVIVQKDVQIKNGNTLCIESNGNKNYDVYDSTSNTQIASFPGSAPVPLNSNLRFEIQVRGAKRSVALKTIRLSYQNGKWDFYYFF